MLTAVLLLPAFTGDDGVPLSSYPMYARERSNVIEFVVPVGLDAADAERRLSTMTIAGTRDPLIAESFLRSEVAAGRVAELCTEIARRSAGDNEVVTIEIRTEVHRVVDRARGEDSLVSQQVVSRCSVPR